MKKLALASFLFLFVWYLVFGVLSFRRSSNTYTDELALSVKEIVRDVQNNAQSPDEAWGYIVRNNFEVVGIDDHHYFKLDVILCDSEWFITAVPSIGDRYLVGLLSRVAFLNFSKVYYPVVLGTADGGQKFLEDPSAVSRYKSIENKCEALDVIDFGNLYYYK